MDYIERIKKIKSEKRITNEKLSELTGIPLGTLSKILAGISDSPKLSNIVLIANALECTVDYIVSGTPENTNNFTLSKDEISLVTKYRSLDKIGKDLLLVVAQKEAERFSAPEKEKTTKTFTEKKSAKILSLPPISTSTDFSRKDVPLYDLPVSAGPGVYLDESLAQVISIPKTSKTISTDYALRISGNSMEPKYHDGDILLVEEAESIEIGELGIFMLDGNGYFKKYGGDRLISLNTEYGDILLRDYAESVCCGRVIGKLKKK